MPKIAEILPMDGSGSICIRLERGYIEEDGPISIYSAKEIEALKRDIALAIMDQINQMYPKPSR